MVLFRFLEGEKKNELIWWINRHVSVKKKKKYVHHLSRMLELTRVDQLCASGFPRRLFKVSPKFLH